MSSDDSPFDLDKKWKVWSQPFIKKKPNLKNAVVDEEPSFFDDLLQYIYIIYKRDFEGVLAKVLSRSNFFVFSWSLAAGQLACLVTDPLILLTALHLSCLGSCCSKSARQFVSSYV
jgi:hypothetical protein